MMYLDSWIDDHGPQSIANPLGTAVKTTDAPILHLRELASLCRLGGECPCTNKAYKDNALAAQLFGQHKVDASFGYSERLHHVLKESGAKPETIRVSALPLGNRSHPGLFTDVLVRSATCADTKNAAASAFADYLVKLDVYEWTLASRDVPSDPRTPRYLRLSCCFSGSPQGLKRLA